MLTTLRIKNLALVEDLTLEFRAGYQAITGETGAGKSILIGALGLVLGERAMKTLLRAGSEACTVEAAFDAAKLDGSLVGFLAENGLEPCEDGQLLLKRSFTAAGANRQFVNGSPSTLAQLVRIGEWLVDFHGPHDHQSLFNSARQLDILDAFGGLEGKRAEFAAAVRRRTALEDEKAALVVDEQTYARQLDLLRFQVREITDARLAEDEEQQLTQDHQRASNAARLLQLCQSALNHLSEDEASLLHQAGTVGRLLQELQRVDASAAPLVAAHDQALAALRDLQAGLSHYQDKVDLDPARLQELEERLNVIHALKRKYGTTLAAVIAFGEEARVKLGQLESRDAELARLNAALAEVDRSILAAGRALTTARRKLLPRLKEAAELQLTELGFKQSQFSVSLESLSALPENRASLASSGLDTVEFQFAPNPGEPPRPLRAIASSGEMARVMLALKTVLAAQDRIPVLVFDEVDANVGGETAAAVGEKMRRLGQQRQVLCITHLPQVAACASHHLVVRKELVGGRTVTLVQSVEGAERIAELARMLGGQSDAARKHARALLAEN